MISPTRPRSPTRTTSNIFAPSSPSAMTTGPLTLETTPMDPTRLAGHRQRDAEHALREGADALDLVLPGGGRYEDDERLQRRLRVHPLAFGERPGDRLARDDEAELAGFDDPAELGLRRRGGHFDDVLEPDQPKADGELALPKDHGTTGVRDVLRHGVPGGVYRYLTATVSERSTRLGAHRRGTRRPLRGRAARPTCRSSGGRGPRRP